MNGDDWPNKYPWRLLPRGGSHPFLPPRKGIWWKHPRRGLQNGFKDAMENEWTPHHPVSGREEDLHWDVEHPNGTHTNVTPLGEVHHGKDNFS